MTSTAARSTPIALLLLAAAVVPGLALGLTRGIDYLLAPSIHLLVVGAAGALAAVAAVALSLVAARLHDGRAVLLGMAFSVMATLLVIHSLSTPDAMIGENGIYHVAGALNLPLGGLILALSALPAFRRPVAIGVMLRAQFAAVGILAVLGGLLFFVPEEVPEVPAPSSDVAYALFAFGAVTLGLLAWRAGRTFLLTGRVGDLLVTVGVVWLVGAQYGLLAFDMGDLPWLVAHGFEVAGIGLIGIPAALDLRHAAASRPLVGDLRAADLVANEEAFLGGRVRALMVRLAEKDGSTEGHTRRVATLAVQIGEALGLPESRLRRLALGGLLHDMGKLSVPDAILNKPGRLEDHEFDVIRRHPAWGRELLSELGGFSEPVLELVESHHERLDATGYPHRAAAATLPLEVRILTVADVFDALTADRVYREAWPADRALALLDDETGSAFDADCVAALRRVAGVAAAAPVWEATLGVPAPAVPVAPAPLARTRELRR